MGRWLAAGLVAICLGSACGERLAASGSTATPSPAALPAASATAISATAVPATIVPDATATATLVVTRLPTPSPTVSPAPPSALTLAQLKYRVIDRFGPLWYCDPDFFPVARLDEGALADQRFPEIAKDAETFAAILTHLGYAASASYTADQRLAIYREWKMLGALRLDPLGTAYHFTARFTPDGNSGSLIDATIDPAGRITVASQIASGRPPCPICLARGTPIATPSGPVAVEDLRAGMAVWTADATGARVAGTVVAIGSMTAPADHEVVHLVLSDGRELRASPTHPLADGRRFGDLAAGDTVDGASVVAAERIGYASGTTFDLLPSGPTGTYWAGGVPLASTLRR